MSEMRFDRVMSDAEGLMWRLEKDPYLSSTFGTVTLLDRAPDWVAGGTPEPLRSRLVELLGEEKLLGRATETFLGVLDTRRSLNVEWYIVILILIELFLLVYELATR